MPPPFRRRDAGAMRRCRNCGAPVSAPVNGSLQGLPPPGPPQSLKSAGSVPGSKNSDSSDRSTKRTRAAYFRSLRHFFGGGGGRLQPRLGSARLPARRAQAPRRRLAGLEARTRRCRGRRGRRRSEDAPPGPGKPAAMWLPSPHPPLLLTAAL
jgi:hypothetical protein